MAAHQDAFTQLPPELTELIMRRLPLESLIDLRSCARSVGMVSVHGLLKGLEIQVGELHLGSRRLTRGGRLRDMTSLTHLKLFVPEFKVPPSPFMRSYPLPPLFCSLQTTHMPCLSEQSSSYICCCPNL